MMSEKASWFRYLIFFVIGSVLIISLFTSYPINTSKGKRAATIVLQKSGIDIKVTEIMQKRQLKIKELCKKEKKSVILDKGADFFRWVFVNDDLKLMGCAIPKVGSTYMKRLLSRDHAYAAGFNKNTRPTLERLSKTKRLKVLKEYKKFLIVRHPLDRLWSAYTSKIMLEREERRWSQIIRKAMVKLARNNPTIKERKCANDVSFSEFVKYIIYSHEHDEPFNPHWEKYRTLCHPCRMRYDVIIQLENFDNEVKYFYNLTKLDEQQVKSWTKSSSSFESVLEAACRLSVESKCENLTEIVEKNYNYFVIEGIVDPIKDRKAIIPPLTRWVKTDFRKKERYGCVETFQALFAGYTEQQSLQLIKSRKRQVRANAFKQINTTDLNKLKDIYMKDFDIFGYDQHVVI